MIELRTLGWGDDPGLTRLAQCNHTCPYKKDKGELELET